MKVYITITATIQGKNSYIRTLAYLYQKFLKNQNH